MNNWHSETISNFKRLSSESLLYIRQDAYQAAKRATVGTRKQDSIGTSFIMRQWSCAAEMSLR